MATQNTSDDTNKTSALGAALRGVVNGLDLGLGDDALTGVSRLTGGYIPDYGATLRSEEAADAQQHPYASMAGQAVGAIAPSFIPAVGEGNDARLAVRAAKLLYTNPAVNGAISAVGNSNDLADGNIPGAVGQAVTGAGEGAIIGKALNMVGNKLATGTFGKVMPRQTEYGYQTGPDNIGTYLQERGVPTPYQYRTMGNNSGVLSETLGNSIQNATRSNPVGLQANRELLNQVNTNFPFHAQQMVRPDGVEGYILDSVEKQNPNGYNATDVKSALDDYINGSFRDARLAGDAPNDYGNRPGVNEWEDAHDVMGSPLYRMASDAAPLHESMMNNVNAIPKESNGSIMRHALSAIPAGVGLAFGHIPGGLLGTALIEGGPTVVRALGNGIGTRSIRNAIDNPLNAQVPVVSDLSKQIGNVVQKTSGPVAGQAAENINTNITGNNVQSDSTSKLKKYGFTDSQIQELMQ